MRSIQRKNNKERKKKWLTEKNKHNQPIATYQTRYGRMEHERLQRFCAVQEKNGDPRMPSSLPLIQQQCINVQDWMSPDCSVHGSDSKDDDEEGDAAASAYNGFGVNKIAEI
jgi:hypothetical protein